MPEENKTVELNDKELEKANGGASEANKGASLSSIAIGDVVEVSGYISGFNGPYCLVSINEYGAYKFVKYQKGAKYIDDAIRFFVIPKKCCNNKNWS